MALIAVATARSSTSTTRWSRCSAAPATSSSAATSTTSPIRTNAIAVLNCCDEPCCSAHEGYRTEQRYLRGDGATVWARTWVSVMARRGRLAGHRAHRGRHRAAPDRRADGVGGHARRPHRAAQPVPVPRTARHRTSTRPPPGSIAVLFIDLDNFKVINDSLGHDAGDQLLRAMSDRLRTVVRDRDLLARFGGDEFIVMLRDVSGNYDPSTWPSGCAPRSPSRCSIDGAELFVTAQHRHHHLRPRRRHHQRDAPRRRRGDVPGQGPRPRLRRGVLARQPRRHGAHPAHHGRAAPRPRARRDRAVLPTHRAARQRAPGRASRCSPGGATPTAACSGPTSSCRWPRRPG